MGVVKGLGIDVLFLRFWCYLQYILYFLDYFVLFSLNVFFIVRFLNEMGSLVFVQMNVNWIVYEGCGVIKVIYIFGR